MNLENSMLEQKKPITGDHILQDSICRKCSELADPQRWADQHCLGLEECRGKRGRCANGRRFSFQGDEDVQRLTVVMAACHGEYTENHRMGEWRLYVKAVTKTNN